MKEVIQGLISDILGAQFNTDKDSADYNPLENQEEWTGVVVEGIANLEAALGADVDDKLALLGAFGSVASKTDLPVETTTAAMSLLPFADLRDGDDVRQSIVSDCLERIRNVSPGDVISDPSGYEKAIGEIKGIMQELTTTLSGVKVPADADGTPRPDLISPEDVEKAWDERDKAWGKLAEFVADKAGAGLEAVPEGVRDMIAQSGDGAPFSYERDSDGAIKLGDDGKPVIKTENDIRVTNDGRLADRFGISPDGKIVEKTKLSPNFEQEMKAYVTALNEAGKGVEGFVRLDDDDVAGLVNAVSRFNATSDGDSPTGAATINADEARALERYGDAVASLHGIEFPETSIDKISDFADRIPDIDAGGFQAGGSGADRESGLTPDSESRGGTGGESSPSTTDSNQEGSLSDRTGAAELQGRSILWKETGNEKLDVMIRSRNAMISNSSVFPIYRMSPAYTFTEMACTLSAFGSKTPIEGKVPTGMDVIYTVNRFLHTNILEFAVMAVAGAILDAVNNVTSDVRDKVEGEPPKPAKADMDHASLVDKRESAVNDVKKGMEQAALDIKSQIAGGAGSASGKVDGFKQLMGGVKACIEQFGPKATEAILRSAFSGVVLNNRDLSVRDAGGKIDAEMTVRMKSAMGTWLEKRFSTVGRGDDAVKLDLSDLWTEDGFDDDEIQDWIENGFTQDEEAADSSTNDGGSGDSADSDGSGDSADGDGSGDSADSDGSGDSADGDGSGDSADGDGSGDSADSDGSGDSADGDGSGDSVGGEGSGESTDGEGKGEATDGKKEDAPPKATREDFEKARTIDRRQEAAAGLRSAMEKVGGDVAKRLGGGGVLERGAKIEGFGQLKGAMERCVKVFGVEGTSALFRQTFGSVIQNNPGISVRRADGSVDSRGTAAMKGRIGAYFERSFSSIGRKGEEKISFDLKDLWNESKYDSEKIEKWMSGEEDPQAKADEAAGEGSDEATSESADDTTGEGADDTTGEGADDTTGEGADDTTGEGADDTTGEGADDTTGEGADDTTGEGADDTTGEGADDTTGEGADDTTGEGADDTTGEGADEAQMETQQRQEGQATAEQRRQGQATNDGNGGTTKEKPEGSGGIEARPQGPQLTEKEQALKDAIVSKFGANPDVKPGRVTSDSEIRGIISDIRGPHGAKNVTQPVARVMASIVADGIDVKQISKGIEGMSGKAFKIQGLSRATADIIKVQRPPVDTGTTSDTGKGLTSEDRRQSGADAVQASGQESQHEGQTAAEQSQESQTSAEETHEGQSTAEQSHEGQSTAEQSHEGQTTAEQSHEGQSTAEQSHEGQSTAEQSHEGQSTAEQSHEGQSTAEQSHEGQSTAEQSHEGQTTAEQSHEGQSTAEQSREGQSTAEQSHEGQSTAEQSHEGQSTAEQSHEGQSTAEQSHEGQATAEQGQEGQTTAEQAQESQMTSEQAQESQMTSEQAQGSQTTAEQTQESQTTAEQTQESQATAEQGQEGGLTSEQGQEAQATAAEQNVEANPEAMQEAQHEGQVEAAQNEQQEGNPEPQQFETNQQAQAQGEASVSKDKEGDAFKEAIEISAAQQAGSTDSDSQQQQPAEQTAQGTDLSAEEGAAGTGTDAAGLGTEDASAQAAQGVAGESVDGQAVQPADAGAGAAVAEEAADGAEGAQTFAESGAGASASETGSAPVASETPVPDTGTSADEGVERTGSSETFQQATMQESSPADSPTASLDAAIDAALSDPTMETSDFLSFGQDGTTILDSIQNGSLTPEDAAEAIVGKIKEHDSSDSEGGGGSSDDGFVAKMADFIGALENAFQEVGTGSVIEDIFQGLDAHSVSDASEGTTLEQIAGNLASSQNVETTTPDNFEEAVEAQKIGDAVVAEAQEPIEKGVTDAATQEEQDLPDATTAEEALKGVSADEGLRDDSVDLTSKPAADVQTTLPEATQPDFTTAPDAATEAAQGAGIEAQQPDQQQFDDGMEASSQGIDAETFL